MKNLSQIQPWLVLVICCIACVGTTLPVISTPFVVRQQPTPQSTPTSDLARYGSIKLVGNPEFITQTRAALALLEQKDPEAFNKIQNYIGIIEQGEHSGIWAWEQPPRYEVGNATAFSSITWYASTIAHDATHSELYAQYQFAHPGQPVPQEAFSGVEIERFCNGYQLDVLKRIGAPQNEIEYMSTLDGTHCDMDNDDDCDWDDYQNRNW